MPTPPTLTLDGKRFVVLPEAEYRRLTATKRNGTPTAAPKARRPKRKPSRQERGDVAEALRALADPRRIPAAEVFRKPGV